MSRSTDQRLGDVLAACDAIETYVARGPRDDPFSDGLVLDAVRARLVEIGEAVKALDRVALAAEPAVPWRDIAGMRDLLAHRYFDASHAIIAATARHDIPELRAAVERILARRRPGD